MSTKRLSKTITEHHGSGKSERKIYHSTERAYERDYCNKVKLDPESADEYDIDFSDECYGQRGYFSSKVLKRWLFAQVGRPWADVRSEIFKKFDAKTVSKHDSLPRLLSYCVDEALSGWDSRGYISANKKDSSRGLSFYVDDSGILKRHDIKNYEYLPNKQILAEVGNWLNGRMVGEKNNKLYWFAPTSGIWKAEYSDESEYSGYNYYGIRNGANKLKYFSWLNSEYIDVHRYQASSYPYSFYPRWIVETTKRFGEHWEHIEIPYSFKQRGELFENDIKYFNSLPERVKLDILKYTENR